MDLLLSPCRSCLRCLPFFHDSPPPSPVRHSTNTAPGSDPATAVPHEHDLPVSEGCAVEVSSPADNQAGKGNESGHGYGEGSANVENEKPQVKLEEDVFFSVNDAASSIAVTAQSEFVDHVKCEDVSSELKIENGHKSEQVAVDTGDDNSFNQQFLQDETSVNFAKSEQHSQQDHHLQYSNDEISSDNLDKGSSEDNGHHAQEESATSIDASSVQNSDSFSTSDVSFEFKKDNTSSSSSDEEGRKGASSNFGALTVKPANDAGKTKGKKKQRRRDRIRNQIAGIQQQIDTVMKEEGLKNQLAVLQQQVKQGGHVVKEEGSKHLRNIFNNVSKQAQQIEESSIFSKRHQNS